jgi:hypothetical protein
VSRPPESCLSATGSTPLSPLKRALSPLSWSSCRCACLAICAAHLFFNAGHKASAADPETAVVMMDPQDPFPPDDSASGLLDQQQPIQSSTGRGWGTRRAPTRPRRFGAPNHGSLYLRRHFLIGIALLLISFVTVLEILNHLSNRDQGFVAAPGGMHYYLWRYGPAAGASPWIEPSQH